MHVARAPGREALQLRDHALRGAEPDPTSPHPARRAVAAAVRAAPGGEHVPEGPGRVVGAVHDGLGGQRAGKGQRVQIGDGLTRRRGHDISAAARDQPGHCLQAPSLAKGRQQLDQGRLAFAQGRGVEFGMAQHLRPHEARVRPARQQQRAGRGPSDASGGDQRRGQGGGAHAHACHVRPEIASGALQGVEGRVLLRVQGRAAGLPAPARQEPGVERLGRGMEVRVAHPDLHMGQPHRRGRQVGQPEGQLAQAIAILVESMEGRLDQEQAQRPHGAPQGGPRPDPPWSSSQKTEPSGSNTTIALCGCVKRSAAPSESPRS